jgi:hypothetical protein
MARLLLKDRTALILCQIPPRGDLANGNQCSAGGLRTMQSRLNGDQRI